MYVHQWINAFTFLFMSSRMHGLANFRILRPHMRIYNGICVHRSTHFAMHTFKDSEYSVHLACIFTAVCRPTVPDVSAFTPLLVLMLNEIFLH